MQPLDISAFGFGVMIGFGDVFEVKVGDLLELIS
jgi:hypothetical protein